MEGWARTTSRQPSAGGRSGPYAAKHSTVIWSARSRVCRDAAGVKRAARAGPVFVTDRGRPAYVLLGIEDYRRLAGGRRSLLDMLSMPGLDDIGFEPPRARIESRPPPLSCAG